MNLYLITEGEFDARILRTVLDCSSYSHVYQYISSGYNNMASICRTLRLMVSDTDKILMAFDTDTEDDESIDNQYSTLVFLTKADVSSVKIGIFPMKPYLERALNFPGNLCCKRLTQELTNYLRQNINRIRNEEVIIDMQNFLNKQ